jgi:hypothetical protein
MEQIIRFMERTNVDSGTQAGNQVPVGDFFSIVIVAFVRQRSTRQRAHELHVERGMLLRPWPGSYTYDLAIWPVIVVPLATGYKISQAG